MILCKKIFFTLLLYLVFSISVVTKSKAQICNGSWTIGSSLNYGCFLGTWIGQFNSNLEPPGCPINPIYTAGQTNTFIFDNPVSGFTIDFYSLTTAAGCGRIEIKIDGIFYPLTAANLFDIPAGAICPGYFSFIEVTNDGYITSTNNSTSSSNGRGRIIINGINGNSVTISANDPAGTLVSAPFNCTSVVPLQLIKFTGKSGNCTADLKWETGIEQNIQNIEIEKSENGISFYKVIRIDPKGSNSQYSFTTDNFKNSYYKLKINDLDGSYNYSSLLYLKSSCDKISYQIIPNPASTEVEITGLKHNDQVSIIDMKGNTVKLFSSPQSSNKFNIQALSKGVYIFKIINGGSNSSLKMIKY